MKNFINVILKDVMVKSGLLLIIISLAIYAASFWIQPKDTLGIFFFNYIISCGYLIAILMNNFKQNRWKFANGKIKHTVLLFVLWLISAFSLNRDMNIFNSSSDWLTVSLILSCLALIFAPYYRILPTYLRSVVFVGVGFAFLLFSYFSIFLIPLYPISTIGILALGISLHTFIPLGLTFIAFILIKRSCKLFSHLKYSVLAGCMVPVVASAIFLFSWNNTNKQINQLANRHSLTAEKLPKWIIVAQNIKPGFVMERILKADLIFDTVDPEGFRWNNFSSNSIDEPLQHDPLVILATLIFDETNLDVKEKLNILKSVYASRHEISDRLWAGDNLVTSNIVSNIKLFPAYRMSYTEQIITIHNTAKFDWNTQEAIYTFQLAEGAVVSSLSLWINGTEEKSRLTTKGKADSAYKTIVGVEQRDPSVVHWQEGNTISLRVFPCSPNENRKFKIGITTPMKKMNNRLIYQSVNFKGPNANDALHTIQVSCGNDLTGVQVPPSFNETTANSFYAETSGQESWELSMNAPPLSNQVFSFRDKNYQLANYSHQRIPFNLQEIYLDLNSQWTHKEFEQVWNSVKKYKVFVYTDVLKQLSSTNKNQFYKELSEQEFSLFPMQTIKTPSNALLISKSNLATPNVTDLSGSAFYKDLSNSLKSPYQIRTFHLGSEISPYLKALIELRVLHCEKGSISDLVDVLDTKQFLHYQEGPKKVVIDDAQMAIQEVNSPPSTTPAPDHLLRLFAYNDIMRKIGQRYFTPAYSTQDLLNEAEEAYIVSPVSSLIVLESQNDYDRFDIEGNKKSLENAAIQSSGAVPEPHEWFLIALFAVVILFLYAKNRESKHKVC